MATVTRYVNPASTPGGDGTTNATSGANRAYASLIEWEADEQTDLVGDGDNHVVYCASGTNNETLHTSVYGWTTGASNKITIQGNPSDWHEGVWDAGYILTSSSTTAVLRIVDDYVDVIGLQLESTQSFAFYVHGNSGGRVLLDKCLVEGSSSQYAVQAASGSNDVEIRNTLIQTTYRGVDIRDATTGACNNVTVHTTGQYCFVGAGVTHKNCVGVGASILDFHGSPSGDYNASEDTSAPGANSVTGVVTTDGTDFKSPSTDDYTPVAGGKLDNAGDDLSGTFTDSVTGVDRFVHTFEDNVFDIGAYEYFPVRRYVNPASTPGGDGTTNGTSGANRAYASLSEWEADEQADLVTAGERHVVECVAGTDTTKCNIDGWTTGASNTITVKAEAGSEHNGVPGGGFKIEASTRYEAVLTLGDDYTYVQDIEIVNTRLQSSAYGFSINRPYCHVKRVIAEAQGPYTGCSAINSNYWSQTYEACIAHGSYQGFYVSNWNTSTFTNCLAINNVERGFYRSGTNGSGPTAKNCVGFNNATADFDTQSVSWLGNNNASSDSTEVGTSPITTDIVSGDFTDEANGDYSIAGTSSTLYDNGANADLPSTDITNAGWTTDDLGPFAYVAGGGGDTNVNTGTETLTLTELQASISLDVNVQTSTEALSLTTYQASIDTSSDTNVQSNTETLTLTTYQATVSLDIDVTTGTESLTLTEQPATVTLNVDVQTGTEALSLTTYQAVVTNPGGNDTNVISNTATLSLTEYAASITYDVNVQAGTEALTLTTRMAAITSGAEAGSFYLDLTGSLGGDVALASQLGSDVALTSKLGGDLNLRGKLH